MSMNTYKEIEEQRCRMGSICQLTYNLFIQSCARDGIPFNESSSQELIERCFMNAQVVTDFVKKQVEPFVFD